MKSLNRRSFLKSTALTAGALSFSARSWSQVEGSNSDVRMAVIGFGGRGQNHISEWTKMEGVRLTALCDVDSTIMSKEVDRLSKANKAVEQFTDIRKLLENKNIDAVSIATPNHWHALAAIWAIQAGKDVYTEKPVSHNVFEGRKLVEAARKYKKIVQTGTQSRSSLGGIGEAVKWVNEGNLGKILIARGLCYKPRPSIGKVTGPQDPPANVNYDLWSGPAPMLPVMRQKFHYDWHWIWAYGNGDLGNQGIHQMDICRWFLGEQELAPAVLSAGGRLGYVDDGETANTQIIFQDYKKAPLIFEVRGLPESTGAKNMDKLKGASVGCIIECEGGYVSVPNYTASTAHDKDGKEIKKFTGNENHFQNFIKAVQSRRTEDLNADILQGHLSSGLCHTGNISYRLGAKKNPDEIKEAIKGDRGMLETFERMSMHLAKNDVDITSDKITLGVPLKMNGKTEKFIGNKAADELLTRNYRAPYIVPEKV
ncbi:MAG TPA: Gfo/Idh/MocA family oxidoreductase [Candidatus Limnocylindria bacterium]|nr:Gfo/Idh/MocA family oxidoreductase [Candidatus Limnocylindria bacterium]